MIRFSKTKDSNKIWIFFILFVACLFMTIGAYAQSKSNIEREKIPKEDQNFKMVVDVLDAVGGKSESDNFKMKIGSGGQSSAIGRSQSTAYEISGGYVYATFVLHGDANADGLINIADAVYLINYLFIGGQPPIPMEAGDANCDRLVNIADVVYLINYLFLGGAPPCGP